MKHINAAIRLLAAHLGLASSFASGEGPVAGREEHPRTRPRLLRWSAALTLAIASVAAPVMAQETGTITITVKSDRTPEPDETFTVELFNVFGGTVGDAVATGTILNDD